MLNVIWWDLQTIWQVISPIWKEAVSGQPGQIYIKSLVPLGKILDKDSGGSRIFPRGAPTPKVGVLTNFFGRKLHENERIWTPGGRTSLAPPLDPPLKDMHFVCVHSSANRSTEMKNNLTYVSGNSFTFINDRHMVAWCF